MSRRIREARAAGLAIATLLSGAAIAGAQVSTSSSFRLSATEVDAAGGRSTSTSYRLDDVCDAGADRLRGVLLDGASGAITDVHVHGVRQGLSGCQEGNGIEARNVDASAGTQMTVTISGNTVADYQKNAITANGNVAATIGGNTVTGDGQIDYIAQNGIQVGFGATALVQDNEVTGNWYTPDSYVACGLLFFEAEGVKQKQNTLDANERNLCNFGRGGGNFEAG